MWIRGCTIGTTLLAGIGAAIAQTPEPTTFAAVDPLGRIRPVAPGQPVETLPGRRNAVSPCAPSADLAPDAAKALIVRIAAEEKFDQNFVLSVARIESRYVSTALSEKGAYGLMQLMPDTARRFDVDLCSPEGNVRGGVHFLRALNERFQNPFLVLAAYNAGEDAVRKSRGVPPYPETVRFVADVMNDFYSLPTPAQPAKAGAERVASARPDIVEPSSGPAALAATAPASANSKLRAPQWSDGFVMHVD
jgi:hypothetical protein